MENSSSRVCLITGGATGIGRQCARLAASNGYTVAIAALPQDQPQAESVIAEVKDLGSDGLAISCDVGQPEQVVSAFDRATGALGGISAVINAAGIVVVAPVESLNADDLHRLMTVNVIGVMLSCREAVRRMSRAGGGTGGSIVNISSMAVTIGGRPGASAYAASKGAVDVFTLGIAKEVARDGIRVNSVRPGSIATPMTVKIQEDAKLRASVEASIPMGRLGEAEEVARAVLWLLSDESSFVTGAHLEVAGGGFVTSASL
jgi:NAD(P)-dependent dehydrogenase (short-subunit alcohol dehydrogenase family)